MKLHSPQFERALRRAVKRKVRASPELKREARRNRRQQHIPGGPLARLIGTVVLATFVWQAWQASGHATSALAVMTLWLAMLACYRAAALQTCLFQPADGAALSSLPISNADVFRWQWQKFIRSSLFSAVDIAVGFATLNLAGGLGWAAWLALPMLTLVASAGLVAVATLLAARAPRLAAFGLIFPTFFGLAIFITVKVVGSDSELAARAWRFLDEQSGWVNALLPTGWLVSLHQLVQPAPPWTGLVCVALTGILIWTLRGSLAILRRNYGFHEMQMPEAPDLLADTDREFAGPLSGSDVPRVGITTVRELIEQRCFLADSRWHERGPLERWLWNWLSARERVLAEFAFPDGLLCTAAWKNTFRNLLIGLAAGFVASYVSRGVGVGIAVLTVFVTGVQVFVQFFATGGAFQKVQSSGVMIPIHAVYAVGFRELARLLFKVSAIQLPLVAVYAMAVALVAGCVLIQPHLPAWSACVMGLKAGGLLAGVRIMVVAANFSSGTNDSTRLRLATFALVVGFVGCWLAFLGLGAAALFVPHVGASWLLFMLALLDAGALFWFYGWFYNANKFDLMSLPPR